MSTLICNLPSIDVWVRKEYLMDHKGGYDEFVRGVWVSCKSIPGRAFYFETYLPDYGALYDDVEFWQRVSMMMGYQDWELGIESEYQKKKKSKKSSGKVIIP